MTPEDIDQLINKKSPLESARAAIFDAAAESYSCKVKRLLMDALSHLDELGDELANEESRIVVRLEEIRREFARRVS